MLHYSTGITLASLLASEKPVTVEAEVKEKRWWLKGTISVEVATAIIKFLGNMTKVNLCHTACITPTISIYILSVNLYMLKFVFLRVL